MWKIGDFEMWETCEEDLGNICKFGENLGKSPKIIDFLPIFQIYS